MTTHSPQVSHDLAQLQAHFQRAILSGDTPDAVAGIVNTNQTSAQARIAIYATAYRLRLIDALAANFPRLAQLLGVEHFQSLARDFIDNYPSQHVSVRWFGHQLVGYLQTRAELQPRPAVAELAEWEWTVAAAFDATDAEALRIEVLASVTPDHWPQLRFVLHPSVHRLALRTNAVDLFRAMDGDATLSPQMIATLEHNSTGGARHWLIWREALTTRFRPLGDDEAEALAVIAQQGTFENLCDKLCDWLPSDDVPVRAASLLKTWMSEGLITGHAL